MLRDSHLQMLWTARVDYEAHSGVEQHKHDNFYQLLLVIFGEGMATLNNEDYPLKEGNIYLFKKGIMHGFYFTEPAITLDYKFRLLNKNIEKMLNVKEWVGVCPNEEFEELKKWYQLSRKIDQTSSDPYNHYRIEAGFKSTFLSLLSHFQKTENVSSKSGIKRSSVFPLVSNEHPIITYIEKNYHRKITLKQLAEHFNYHPHHIIKIFQEEVGMPPIQYLQEVRMLKACYFLEYTKLSVSEIARHIGMTPPYFSRIFREKEGMSPTTYREYLVDYVGKDIVLTEDFINNWRIRKK